jgi:hypothetical protein
MPWRMKTEFIVPLLVKIEIEINIQAAIHTAFFLLVCAIVRTIPTLHDKTINE